MWRVDECIHDYGLSSLSSLHLPTIFTLTLREQSHSPTPMTISYTADYSIICLITHPLTLCARVECRYVCKKRAWAPEHVHPKDAIIITLQGFFHPDMMHSYKTITNANNNFFTLPCAIITVPVQFMPYTNRPGRAPGEVRLSFAVLCVDILFSLCFSVLSSWFDKNHTMWTH